MVNWKEQNLKTKLSALGFVYLGSGKYLDEGTGEILTEQKVMTLARTSGKPRAEVKPFRKNSNSRRYA